jgi:glutamyl-tRNA reductase
VLSTCNRSEIYCVAPDGLATASELERFLSDYHRVPKEEFRSHLYRHGQKECARHLFRVSSGIDSMVLGESQILGQVREAFQLARSAGSIKLVLDELFRRALSVGKRSRSETGIGKGALSVGSAAVELARTIFGALEGHTILILGAGKMSELTVRHLIDSGARSVIVSNRTHERAVELARLFCGRAIAFEEVAQYLTDADIVIASTAAPHFVITHDTVRNAMRARRSRPLFLIDIAVPRNIEPRVNELDNVFVYDIDDLQVQVEQNRAEREREVLRVEQIIHEEVAGFSSWLQQLDVKPLIAGLSQRTDEIYTRKVEETLARLPGLDNREREIVRGMGKGIAYEMMHRVFSHLRAASARDDGYVDIEVLRRAMLEPDQTQAAPEAEDSGPARPGAADA